MWQMQKWLKVGGLTFAVAATIAGLRFVAYPAFVSAPDHVHVVVTRIQPPSGDRTIVFDQEFAGVARQVYAQLVAGVPIPPNTKINCPSSGLAPYYHYDLAFSRAGMQTGIASSNVEGCRTRATRGKQRQAQVVRRDPVCVPILPTSKSVWCERWLTVSPCEKPLADLVSLSPR